MIRMINLATMTKKHSKKNIRKNGEVDLRTLPVDERPNPTSGQSRKEFKLAADALSKFEAKIVAALNGKGKGLRETISVTDLGKQVRLTPLQVRNSIRRLVPSSWVEPVSEVLTDEGETKPARGHYRLTEAARKRLA